MQIWKWLFIAERVGGGGGGEGGGDNLRELRGGH